jgi:hypothetical protein
MNMSELEVHIVEENGHHVMIRNKNTSRSIQKYISEAHAKAHQRTLEALPRIRLIEVYTDAKARSTMVRMHNYRFGGKKIIDIRKVEGSKEYGLYILVNKREVLIMTKKYKMDVESYAKTVQLEYTDEEIVAKTRAMVMDKLTILKMKGRV